MRHVHSYRALEVTQSIVFNKFGLNAIDSVNKKKMKFIIILLVGLTVAFVNFGYGDPLKSHLLTGKSFYQSLPKAERLDFLAFSLGNGYTKNETKLQRVVPDFQFPDALGIDKNLVEKFKTLDVPNNFTTNLYSWIQSRFNLDQPKMRTLILSRSVCLSSGNCIDIDDIGGLCCPF